MSILDKHSYIERNASLLLLFSLLVVTIGGIVEIAPLFYLQNTIENRCMTIRSSGAPSAPDPTLPALEIVIPMHGMCSI